MFEAAVPPAIRQQATTLLRQLTHPSPSLRLPRSFGEARVAFGNMEWLLRRVDILILTLTKALAQADRLSRRKLESEKSA